MRPLLRLERRLEALRALDRGDVAVELERMLNDGYAHVLEMEAERARTRRRVAELAVRADEPAVAAELRDRAAALADLDADIAALRRLLRQAERLGPVGGTAASA